MLIYKTRDYWDFSKLGSTKIDMDRVNINNIKLGLFYHSSSKLRFVSWIENFKFIEDGRTIEFSGVDYDPNRNMLALVACDATDVEDIIDLFTSKTRRLAQW